MAIKCSVGSSSTSRDRSLLKRRRASSSRMTAVQRIPARQGAPDATPPRGWLLLVDERPLDDDDEPQEPSASWAW